MNEAETDARLRALLAPPDEFPDELFAARVARTIHAEAHLVTARRATWRRFAVDCAGTGATLAVFLLLGLAAPPSDVIGWSPALAGVAMIGFWVLTAMRPDTA